MEFSISSSKKSKRVTEDMVLSDSVSGVSRSGRVRKKSAKLMEMEDFHTPFYENEFSAEASNPTSSGPAAGVSVGLAKGRKKPFASTPAKAGSPAPLPPIPSLHIPSLALNQTKRKSTPMSPTSRGSTSIGSSIVKVPHSPVHKGEKVVAIKQIPPPTGSFDSLSGSAYLMGDDIHFITGEPVDSGDGGAADDDEQFSPLKIEVGETDEPSVSLQDETGLKMKFILSPKQSNKKESSSSTLKKKSSSSKKRKTGSMEVSKSSKKPGGGSSKSKKSRACAVEGLLALDVLASGGILPDDGGAISSSLMMDSSEDDDPESKLIIAEPPSLPLKSKKKKKTSSHGSKLGPIVALKSKKKSDSSLNQQQSVYFKEKNSKKKPSKKLAKKKEEKSEKKKRPVSAYMLWCRENRKRVVSDLPHTSDFATISRKMAEIWRSLSDTEKGNWRRKAKNLSFKNSISTGAKMLDTTENKGKSVYKQQSSAKLHELLEPIPLLSPNAKEIHKTVGTTPLDVAAHLKLLGESLSIIGQRLTEHEGQIAVSGSLSVLLDSTLCALGPLLCLTSEVRQLNGCSKRLQESILDNIAYIMPGL